MAEESDIKSQLEQYIKNSQLQIIVRPNSPKNEIRGYCSSRKALKVNIKAPAEDNKANIEIIKFFSRLTGKKAKIISGMAGKKKVLKFIG